MARKRVCAFGALFGLAAPAAAQPVSGDMRSPGGAVYRVMPAEGNEVAPFVVKPVDLGEPLPERQVRLEVVEPTRLDDLVDRVLDGTDIVSVFVGDDILSRRLISEVKMSGRLQAVVSTLSQAVDAQYIYRDGTLRFVPKRSYMVGYTDADEGRYLPSMIRKAGGAVVSTIDARREVIFTADQAALGRIRGELAGLVALKRDPGRQAASRNLVTPQRPVGVVSGGSTAGGGLDAIVRVMDGKATIRWHGDATELVRHLAAATGAVYAGTHGQPKPLRVQVSFSDKPLLAALEAVGAAMGASADLVVRGNRYLIAFR